MKVFLTGATGFIGRKLALRLARDGHQVTAWVRDPERAREVLGAEVELLSTTIADDRLADALTGTDAVINLAGTPVAQRWTDRVKTSIDTSRAGLTRRIVAAMNACERAPSTLISASATGLYRDGGQASLDEDAPQGDTFLADVCKRWEAAADEASALGTRVVLMRIGLVLGLDGGAYAAMRAPFAWGLGASLGTGEQYMPWIHIDDLLDLMMTALVDDRLRGPYNATAPNPVTNAEFSQRLAGSFGRRARLRVPAWLLRLGLGEAARIMLVSHRVVPKRALEQGITFRFADLDAALADLARPESITIAPAIAPPERDYLAKRTPRYVLETTTVLDAPRDEVFRFFEQAANLGAMTPPEMGFRIIEGPADAIAKQTTLRYRIRLGPVRLTWKTSIEEWQPVERFADAQIKGPYHCWYHEHEFEEHDGQTVMTDRVWYAPPLGPLGVIAHAIYVKNTLRWIFTFRTRAIAHRFGNGDRKPKPSAPPAETRPTLTGS